MSAWVNETLSGGFDNKKVVVRHSRGAAPALSCYSEYQVFLKSLKEQVVLYKVSLTMRITDSIIGHCAMHAVCRC